VGLAAGLAALVLVPLAIWGITALSDEEPPALTVETIAAPPGGFPEIVVSLPSDDLNVPETVEGARSVGLECTDTSGKVEFRVEHLFPFTDTDGGTVPPHVHQQVSPGQLEAVERCRLEGTTVELEGELRAGSEQTPEPPALGF
jgi:hypothetical protein